MKLETEIQIDQAMPGKELDRWVATEVMGHQVVNDVIFGLMEMHITHRGENLYHPLRAYSKDLLSAQRVIHKMNQMAYHDEVAYWYMEDRPEVICKAALKAVFQRKKKDEYSKRRACLKIVK
jgi:hypothetical protein